MSVSTNGRVIRREDLETAFARLLGEGTDAAGRFVPSGMVVGGAVALALAALVYMAGRRRGRRRSSVIEIRRL